MSEIYESTGLASSPLEGCCVLRFGWRNLALFTLRIRFVICANLLIPQPESRTCWLTFCMWTDRLLIFRFLFIESLIWVILLNFIAHLLLQWIFIWFTHLSVNRSWVRPHDQSPVSRLRLSKIETTNVYLCRGRWLHIRACRRRCKWCELGQLARAIKGSMLGAADDAFLCMLGNDCGLVVVWLLMQVLHPVTTEMLRGAERDHFSETVGLRGGVFVHAGWAG